MLNRRIIIMSASIGHGHNKVASVLKESLLKQDDQLEIKIVDFMEVLETLFGQFIISAYLKIIDTFPSWYHFFYHITSNMKRGDTVKDIFAYRYKKKVLNIIKEFEPDAIIFTNPFLLVVASYLKRTGKINCYTATVITDYTAHSIWIDSTINKYFVGCNDLKNRLNLEGIGDKDIIVSGIPIDERFYQNNYEDSIRIKLGLKEDIPTVLIMGGGLGVGSIEEVLDNLNLVKKPIQIIVVTGTNSTLKQRLEHKCNDYIHYTEILGFCNNIFELMECSDVLISKSGGVTVTEAISKKLPMLIVDPIPGQELENASYLEQVGAAILIKDISEIQDKVEVLLYRDKKLYEEMKVNLDQFKVKRSGEEIARFILDDIGTHEKKSGRSLKN